MRFWFRVFSPHQSRWRTYATAEKRKLIHDHAAAAFEDVCRARFPGAQRYWEGNVELNLVAPDQDDRKRLLVAEVKWRRLTVAERQNGRTRSVSLKASGRTVPFFPHAQSLGSADKIGERLDAHLPHDVRAVHLVILFRRRQGGGKSKP